MKRRLQVLAVSTLLLGSQGPALGGDTGSGAPGPFDVARIHFEQNATDGDVEVVVEVEGEDEGMTKLAVVSPDGRTIIDVTAPDATTLGIRQFRFESPEPEDVESLKAAYPEGVYSFSGATAAGDKLHGESRLVHSLPETTAIIQPEPGARGVAASGLEITWSPIDNLSAYIINIEQDALNASLTARLPGSATGFAVPDGFLLPGTKYELGIGSVGDDGNISFVETTFTTAGKK